MNGINISKVELNQVSLLSIEVNLDFVMFHLNRLGLLQQMDEKQ